MYVKVESDIINYNANDIIASPEFHVEKTPTKPSDKKIVVESTSYTVKP